MHYDYFSEYRIYTITYNKTISFPFDYYGAAFGIFLFVSNFPLTLYNGQFIQGKWGLQRNESVTVKPTVVIECDLASKSRSVHSNLD